jgi:hypothetical protein
MVVDQNNILLSLVAHAFLIIPSAPVANYLAMIDNYVYPGKCQLSSPYLARASVGRNISDGGDQAGIARILSLAMSPYRNELLVRPISTIGRYENHHNVIFHPKLSTHNGNVVTH